jgi:hypothetical protein
MDDPNNLYTVLAWEMEYNVTSNHGLPHALGQILSKFPNVRILRQECEVPIQSLNEAICR